MATLDPTRAGAFISMVALQFDQRHFADTSPVALKGDFLKNSEPRQAGIIDMQPKDMQILFCNSADNFSNWLKITRYYESPLADLQREGVRQAAIEASAKELLVRLNQPLRYIKPYSEQLLTYVFQEAFNRAQNDTRADERERIIEQASDLQSQLDKLPLTFRRAKYKVEAFFAYWLNSFWVQVVLVYGAYKAYQSFQPRIYHYLSQTVIPRGVNYLINHAHISVITVVSGGVALAQCAYKHYWKTTAAFFAVKWVTSGIPYIDRTVRAVETCAFFPGKIMGYFFLSPFRLFMSSWSMQSSLTASVSSMKDRSKAQLLEQGGMNAYRVWMQLMQGGVQTIAPQAPAA
jgi:cell division protein FtsB